MGNNIIEMMKAPIDTHNKRSVLHHDSQWLVYRWHPEGSTVHILQSFHVWLGVILIFHVREKIFH